MVANTIIIKYLERIPRGGKALRALARPFKCSVQVRSDDGHVGHAPRRAAGSRGGLRDADPHRVPVPGHEATERLGRHAHPALVRARPSGEPAAQKHRRFVSAQIMSLNSLSDLSKKCRMVPKIIKLLV